MPSWVAKELNSHLFAFFWSGKKAKVSRKVVVQPKDCGGFSVVSIEHKAQALLVQWVKRYVVSPSSWVSLFTYWCFDRYGIDPLDVLAGPSEFFPRRLPPFYASLLYAWRAVGGSLYPSDTLSISGRSGARKPVSSVSCKYTYARLLELSRVDPHCVEKFRPVFGDLYWPFTWKQLFFMLLDRPVVGLSWKVAHGALFTMDRLVSFVVISPLLAFPVSILSRPNICSSTALLLRVVSIGFSLCCFYLLHLPPLFGFNPDELRVIPRVFVYLLHVFKFLIRNQRNDFRFRSVRPGALSLLAGLKSRLRFHLPVFFKRFVSARRKRYLIRQWGGNGVVCSLRGSDLVFHI